MREETASSNGGPGTAGGDTRPSAWFWHLYLFFRPRAFFRHFALSPVPALTLGCAWLYGAVSAIDRIEMNQLRGRPTLWIDLGDWNTYLLGISLLGVVTGALHFVVGGWWYRVRVRWSGAVEPDRGLARRVYLFSSQIWVLPTFLLEVFEISRFETPLDSLQSEGSDWLLLLFVLPFWSVAASYVGVRTVFDVRRLPSTMWFIVVPSLFYGVMFAAVIGVAVFSAPAVDTPLAYRGRTMEFQYPANWWVVLEETEESVESLGIEGMPDAYVRVMTYESPSSAEEELEGTMAGLAGLEDWTRRDSFETWGRLDAGAGAHATYVQDGIPVDVAVFVSRLRDGRFFELQSFVARSESETVSPVLRLLERTLTAE